MTLSKYKQSVVKALVENESNGLPDYSQQVQQAVGRNIQPTFVAPVQPLPSQNQPQHLIQPKQEIRPMTAVTPLDEISDFTSGYTSPVKPIEQVQNIAQKPQERPITDFTPQVDDNKFVSTNKDIKGGVDTLDEASYLFERLGNTIGTWVNQVPAFLGTVGLKKDQTSQYTTPEEQKAQLEKLGMDTSKLPENYTKSLVETTNKPYQQQFWEDVIKYEVVKDQSQKINEKYEGKVDDFTKFAGDVSTGALDMLPQTALAYLSGGTSAMAYVFAKSASQSTKQAVSLGAEPEQAKTYGLVMGAIEVGTEMISGGWAGAPKGMGWASKGVMDTVQEQVLKFAKTDLSKKVIDMGMEYLGEGFEEYMSEVLGNYANKIIDQDVKSFGEIQKDAFYAGLVGTFTAMFSQMGQIATVKVAENIVKNDVTTFESLPKEQQLEYAKSVLDKTNTNIVFADNFEGQEVKGEGMFTVKDGQKTIVLPTRMETDKNNLLTVSLMHEFTHTLEQNGEYDNFKSMVIDNLEQTGILDMLRENKKSLYKDENLTDDEIDQEIVATFVQDNIFKRVGKVDGEITTYTDPLAFRKFMKDMGKQDYNAFKKLVNGFLNAYYKGEMTEQYDSLVKQYNKADVNQKPEIAKQMSQLIQQMDLTNPSITKSMEFAFNELANSVQSEVKSTRQTKQMIAEEQKQDKQEVVIKTNTIFKNAPQELVDMVSKINLELPTDSLGHNKDFVKFFNDNKEEYGWDKFTNNELNQFWKDVKFEEVNKNVHEITDDESGKTIKGKMPQSLFHGWFIEANSNYKPKIESFILNNPDVYNAALNNLWRNYNDELYIKNKKEITFDEFLNTDIKLYRGWKNTTSRSKMIEDDVFISFSLREDIAKKFKGYENGYIEELLIKPSDTYGSINRSSEGEVMIPKFMLTEKTKQPEKIDIYVNGNKIISNKDMIDQIKLDNENIGIKNDLIALHNIDSKNISRLIELGGLPVPSIAVTKSNIGHSRFGDVTFVMNPDVLEESPTYSSDAWTPTFPNIETGKKPKLEEIVNNMIYRKDYTKENLASNTVAQKTRLSDVMKSKEDIIKQKENIGIDDKYYDNINLTSNRIQASLDLLQDLIEYPKVAFSWNNVLVDYLKENGTNLSEDSLNNYIKQQTDKEVTSWNEQDKIDNYGSIMFDYEGFTNNRFENMLGKYDQEDLTNIDRRVQSSEIEGDKVKYNVLVGYKEVKGTDYFETEPKYVDFTVPLKKINAEMGNSISDFIIKQYKTVKNTMTTYFESKPQRAIGFNEIDLAVIPSKLEQGIKDSLTENGIPYEEYNTPEERKNIVMAQNRSKFMLTEEKNKPVERFAEPTLEELNAPETETRSVPLTTLESGVLTEEQATNLRTQIEQGKFQYEPFGDKRALAYADGKVKSNPEQAYQDFKSSYENNRTMNKNDIAVAERLIKHFADTNNFAQVEELIGMVADIGTQLGQQVQALSLIKKMSPAGQTMAIEKVVNRIEESYRGTKLEQTTDYAMPEVKTPSIEAKQAIKEFSGEKDKVTNWNGENVSDIQKSINKIAKKRQVEGAAVLIDQTLVDNLKNATEETRPEAVNAIKADAKKKLNNVIKSLGKLQKTYEGKKIDLTIDPALKEELLSAKNQDEIDAVVEKIKEDVASRLPSTLGDKLQAWRFLSMLGNPKTHIRNIVSNATFGTTAKIKDKIALAIEQGFIKPEDRTKALNVKKGIKNFAKSTFNKHVNEITATGKYDMTRDIESRKKVFDTKLLENKRIKNSNVLEKEDIIAMHGAFTDVLGQFMTARNYDPKTITDDQLQKAIEYASEQAKIRTFRQYSKTASMLNQIEKTNAFTKVLIGSLVPFKKTPINILKTGFEYSPAGLALNIPYGIMQVKKGVENGGWTPTQFVDKISAGLTGSGIALLGAALFNMGILSVGDDDDKSKKETNFDSSLGKQRYSLNFGDYSVSLDWLSPAVMPLMVGAEMAKWWKQDKGNNIIDESAEALTNIFNPAFDLTMLQGVSDTFKSFESAGSSQIGDILTTVLANYSTQFFPTVGGQIAKTIDPNVRSTYAGSGLSGTIDTTINKIKNKIPFLSMQNEPVINVKGQEVLQVGGKDNSVGNVVIRSIQNFLNPANIKENIASETDSEIMKVFKQTGDTSVIPSLAPSSFTYDGQKIDLQGEDKTNYAKNMGTVAYNALNEVFDSKLYDGLTDEMKSDVIKDTLTYASSVAKNKVLGGNFVNTSLQNMSEAEDNGVSISEYLIMNSKLDTIKSTEDFTRKEQFIANLVYAGYTDDEIYRYLVYVGDYSYDKSDQKYIDTLRSVE